MAGKSLMERFAGNSFYLFLDWIGVSILSFVFWIMVWKTLPPYDAGIIATVLNTIILISAGSTLGMELAISKMTAEFSKRGAQRKINYMVRFTNKILFFLNLSVSLVFISTILIFDIDMNLPMSGIVMISLGILVWPFVISTNAVLQGMQNMKRIFKTNLLSNMAKLAFAAVMIFLGLGFIGPLYSILVASIVIVLLRKDIVLLGNRAKQKIDVKGFIRKYSLPSLATAISWAAFTNTPVIILTVLENLKSSGIFSAATSMINPLIVIPSLATSALFPIMSSLMVTKNRIAAQSKMMRSVVRYVIFLTTPIWIIYIFFAESFVLLFARVEYIEAVQIIPLMAFIAMFRGLGDIFLYNLYAIRKTVVSRNIAIMSAVIFLGASLYMTSVMGIMGMVWAFFISVVIFTLTSYFFLKKAIRFSMPWKDVSKIALAATSMFLLLAASDYLGLDVAVKILFLVAGGALYLAVLGWTGFYSKEDITILKFSERRMPFLKPYLNVVYKVMRKLSSRRI